jgi:hypothetical protein
MFCGRLIFLSSLLLLKLFDLQDVYRRNIGRINMEHILPLYYPRNISQSDGGLKYRPNRVDLGACDS